MTQVSPGQTSIPTHSLLVFIAASSLGLPTSCPLVLLVVGSSGVCKEGEEGTELLWKGKAEDEVVERSGGPSSAEARDGQLVPQAAFAGNVSVPGRGQHRNEVKSPKVMRLLRSRPRGQRGSGRAAGPLHT